MAAAQAVLTVQDFTLTVTPSSSSSSPWVVTAGQTVNFTVSAAGVNGFSSPINLGLNLPGPQSLPEGTVSPGGAPANFTWIVPAHTAGGPFNYSVSAGYGGLAHSVTGQLSIAAQDYSVSVAQSPIQTVSSPGSASFTMTLTSINSFAGTVFLVGVQPFGWSITGLPAVTLTAGETTTVPFTMNFSTGYPSGLAQFDISTQGGFNTGGYISHNALGSVTFGSSSVFTLSISSTHSGSFSVGQSGSYTVSVTNQTGGAPTSGLVTVTDALPAGLTLASMSGTGWTCTGNSCSRSDSLNGGYSYPPIAVSVNVGLNAPSQVVNQVSVAYAVGGNPQSASGADITTIQGTGFTLIVSPSPQPVIPGQTASFQISVSGSPSFNSAVNLNIGALAGRLSASLSSTTIQPGQSVTLSVTTSTTTPLVALPILITGSAGSLSSSRPAVMNMVAGGQTITLATLSLVPGGPQRMAYFSPALEGDLVTSCSTSGSSEPGNITVGVVPYLAQQLAIGVTATSAATPTTTSVSCSTAAGKTLTVPLEINLADEPQISGVEQDGLDSDGISIDFTIYGAYFGSGGTVSIIGLGSALVTGWYGSDDDDGEGDWVTIAVQGLPTTCDANDDGYQYALTLTSDDYDSEAESGFIYYPCLDYPLEPSPAGPTLVVTATNQTATMPLTPTGTPYPAGIPYAVLPTAVANCGAFLDATPAMPQISATIVPGGAPLSGNATWQMITSFTRVTRNLALPWNQQIGSYLDVNTVPVQQLTQSATLPFQPQFSSIFGGVATINWTYQGSTQSFKFFLCGTNPGTNANFATEQAYITANVPYWFGWKIALHETNASQFCQAFQQQSGYCSDPNNWGYPVFGKPAGYGIMQVDPVTSQAPLWDWTAAVQAAATRLMSLSGPVQPQQPLLPNSSGAYPYWYQQVSQFNAYNAIQAAAGLPTVPGPPPQQESTCTFTMPTDSNGNGIVGPAAGLPPNTYSFGDAILIKQYGGTYDSYRATGTIQGDVLASSKANYISWQNGPSVATQPFWQFFKPNDVSADVVQEVCSTTMPGAGYSAQAPQFLPWFSSVGIAPSLLASGATAVATFNLVGPVPAAGTVVGLTSTNQSVFPVPQFVLVPGGVSSFSLNITAGPVTSLTLAQVTVSYYGITSTGTVRVQPQQ
jgi:uncharacterized repeat protein (TIGR01451 family)